jgi:hypothetical protein
MRPAFRIVSRPIPAATMAGVATNGAARATSPSVLSANRDAMTRPVTPATASPARPPMFRSRARLVVGSARATGGTVTG